MQKELVLLKRGKPVVQKDIVKISEAIEKDKASLLYMLFELLQLCEERMKIEHSVSFLFENVFEDMQIETVEQVPKTKEIGKIPSLILNLSGYDVLLFEEEEGFSVKCPSLPGCISQGGTEKEAIKNAKDAITGYLECARKHGIAVRQ